MATVADITRTCKTMHLRDVEVITRGDLDFRAYAPPGQVFVASGGHSICVGFQSDKPAWVAEVLRELGMGLDRCTDADCEFCADE